MKKINSSNAKANQYGHSKANSKRTRKKMDALEKKKIIASLTLMDDLFMQVVLEEQACTEYILQSAVKNQIDFAIQQNYIVETPDYWQITEHGKLFLNELLALFLDE